MQDRSALTPGQEFGRYQVLELVGRGGMGEVYRAHDSRFDRPVAIKAMTGAIASDPRARRLFVREARHAARVVHPYVATVFDVVDRPEGPLLVMEHIRGRSLDRILAEGPLGPGRAVRYAREIAEALSAIHTAGIVHRDLKPSNVMVTEQDHVKVMDFGVAQRLPSAAGTDSSTQTTPEAGRVAGTLAYMAPEQLRAEPADPRSDLFSLGVLLFEAVTGRHPFLGPTVAETVGAVLHEPPGREEDRSRVRETGALGAAILRLLEKDPARRFESAGELTDQLEHGVVPGVSSRPRWGKTARVAAVLGLAGTLVLAGVVIRRAIHPPTPRSRAAVAVLPFEDRTGSEEGADRGRMVADLMGASLGESSQLRSVATERISEVLSGLPGAPSRAERLRRVRDEVAPAWIVAGTLYRDGDEVIAAVEIYQGPDLGGAGSFQARARASGELAEQIARHVGQAIGAPIATSFSAARPTPVFSSNEEALALQERARGLVRRLDYAQAIPVLERALAADPQFLDAQVLLADVLNRAGYEGRARETIQRALRIVESRNLSKDARQWLEARAVYGQLFDPAESMGSLGRLAELYRDEPEVLLTFATGLRAEGKLDDAIHEVDRALQLDSRDPRGHLSRARTLILLGRPKEASDELAVARDLFGTIGAVEGLAEVSESRALALYRAGRFPEAAKLYREAQAQFRSAGLEAHEMSALRSEADALVQAWDLDPASDAYRRALTGLRRSGHYSEAVRALAGLGGLLYRAGRVDEAEPKLLEAIDEARKLGNERLLYLPLLNLSTLYCVTGRAAEAREQARQVLEISRSLGNAEMTFSARLLEALADRQDGHLLEAIAELRELSEQAQAQKHSAVQRATVLGHLAQVLELVERPGDALAAVSEAIELTSGPSRPAETAFHFGCRARLHAQLARFAEAEADLREAAAVSSQHPLTPEVAHMLARSRATFLQARERWEGAAEAAVVSDGAPSYDRASLAVLRSGSFLRLRRPAEAADLARRVGSDRWSSAADRAAAGLVLAQALMDLGRMGEAKRNARAVLADAKARGQPLLAARAACILVNASAGEGDLEPLCAAVRDGRGQYLQAVPSERRSEVEARWDLREVSRAVGCKP